MGILSIENRTFVVHKRHEGHGYGTILTMLKQVKGVTSTKRTIRKLCEKFLATGSVADKKRSGTPLFGTEEHREYLDNLIKEKPDKIAKELQQDIVLRFNIRPSLTRINEVRRSLGYTSTSVKYCQLIRDVNKVKRMEWCQEMVRTNEQFDNVIFTDESKVQSHQNRRRLTYRKHGEPVPKTPKPKHPYSVMVWGGISKRGATGIVIFDGIMKSDFYQESILRDTLIPFINANYQDSHRFMQDNDPKHTSRSTKEFMTTNNINWWPTSPESPDLNPIEKLWNELKNYAGEAKTKDQLLARITTFWATVTPEKCTRYINHIQKVIPVVIEKQGGPSGD